MDLRFEVMTPARSSQMVQYNTKKLDPNRTGLGSSSEIFFCERSTRWLPRTTNVVITELIGMTGPWRRGTECAAGRRARRIGAASKLVMNRIHQVLTDAPRIGLSHVGRRWNDHGRRLSVHLCVITTVPRPIHRKVVGPNLCHRVRVTGAGIVAKRNE